MMSVNSKDVLCVVYNFSCGWINGYAVSYREYRMYIKVIFYVFMSLTMYMYNVN